MNLKERNIKVGTVLRAWYEKALDPERSVTEDDYKNALTKLFNTTAWGFREILLVVLVGMKLNPTYRASSALYSCNPRAIYEGPIKEFLIEKEIPHRKSGPLNVAKATVGLDETWAHQRRPKIVAMATVELIKYLESEKDKMEKRVDALGVSVLKRLLNETMRLESLKIELSPSSDPLFITHLCCELINKAPDAGNTPQKISAYLLKHYHLSMNTGVVVTGGEDRASVTSTTSKKPGDVNEESSGGLILKVYEVTVKPFDIARIRDSYDCVRIYNETHNSDINEIIVICRKVDCPTEVVNSNGLHSILGTYRYKNLIYYYWDIYEWIASTLQRMHASGRLGFYKELNEYIDDVNTSDKVKALWHKLHE